MNTTQKRYLARLIRQYGAPAILREISDVYADEAQRLFQISGNQSNVPFRYVSALLAALAGGIEQLTKTR